MVEYNTITTLNLKSVLTQSFENIFILCNCSRFTEISLFFGRNIADFEKMKKKTKIKIFYSM